MALKRTLIYRLFNSRMSSLAPAIQALTPPNPSKIALDPGDDGVFRRFLQRRPMYKSAATSPELRSLPTGEKLLEKLRLMDIARDRIRLDVLPSSPSTTEGKLTAEDARKLLRVSQLEMVKSKLRQIRKSYISYAEFVQICVECCMNTDQGLEFAKTLDESGTVIVLGNVVFLMPDQVVKAIQGLMSVPVAHQSDPRMMEELEEMAKQKAAIDEKAEALVRRELWCGLGYLVVQTVAFMRLTFWELSWDVMEPICFYVTSVYFMGGYAFFLRTSKEPSFEGFFQSRFRAKQKRLMKTHDFDIGRYNELRKACYPHSSSLEDPLSFTKSWNSET
ncbi:calcium uniporter protein 2, mitochondrial-like [Cornus florida]|uniref:calcium uniporter protein 2, mitochondrial-like n=1 Tax=Cornus florida TaxID=4283 RepID=UPI00289D51A1|nr:calcium uniporter protein 2, mitochondrial-like [Cornus florida]